MAFTFGTPAAPTVSTGFTFGTPAAAPAPAPGFTFGTPAAAPAPGLTFGTPAAAPAPAAGFTFGTPAAAPAPAAGFTFGAPAPAPAAGFTFGAPAAAPASSGFTFGAPAAAPAPGFTFGAPAAAPGVYGAAAPPSANAELVAEYKSLCDAYGVPPTPQPTAAVAGVATSTSAYSTQAAQMARQLSHFKWIFYNMKDPRASVEQYQRPIELTDQEWFRAKQQNPNDRMFVPVPVVGFDGLVTRLEAQDVTINKFLEFSKELLAKVRTTELAAHTTRHVMERLRDDRAKLSERLLRVMDKVDRLLARGKPWRPEEMDLRANLGRMLDALNKPTEFHAKLSELESLQHMQAGQKPGAKHAVSPTDLEKLYQCLDSQRQGLEHLMEIMRKDRRDLSIIRDSLAERTPTGEWQPPVEADPVRTLGVGAGGGGAMGPSAVPQLGSTAFLTPRQGV